MILINRESVMVLGLRQDRYRIGATIDNASKKNLNIMWLYGITKTPEGVGLSFTEKADDADLMSEESAFITASSIMLMIQAKAAGVGVMPNGSREKCFAFGEEMYSCEIIRDADGVARPIHLRRITPRKA